jgi:molecular chaperone DnaK
MSVAIGIDLGTTNTAVAAVVDGVAVTLEDEQGRRLLPSIVSFHPSGTVLVGEPARERRFVDPENTIFSIKPILGRAFDSDEVQGVRGRFPFQMVAGAKNATMVVARDVAYALPEISAFVLRRAKAIAESALKTKVERAVITVPANFNDLQRASTKIAGKLAGLEVMRILNEPTAAALAYGQSISKAEKIAVYDLGGGTFDITLLDLTGSVFEVLATAGDTSLGGDDLDRLVADRIAMEVVKRFNFDPRAHPVSFGRIQVAAEELKKELSSAHQAEREISGIGYGEGGVPLSMRFAMRRDELERLVLPLLERTVAVAMQSIEIVGLHPKDFDRVILVGGSTRMPLVGRMVEHLFGQAPHLRVNPDEVVALGAAIQAHALGRSRKTSRRPSASAPPGGGAFPRAPGLPADLSAPQPPPPAAELGGFTKTHAVITFSPPPPGGRQGRTEHARPEPRRPSGRPIEGAPLRAELTEPPPSPKPPRRSSGAVAIPSAPELELAHRESGVGAIVAEGGPPPGAALPAPMVPPDEAMFSRGSAIATAASAPLLIDVTPLSLRVETVGGYSDVLIAANSPVPCEKSRTFLTASDGQTTVFIRVAQGESVRFSDNTHLGALELSELRPARRGEVKILVTFELDVDGILNVRAKDKDTGRETAATMRVLGASTDTADVAEMAARQAARHIA